MAHGIGVLDTFRSVPSVAEKGPLHAPPDTRAEAEAIVVIVWGWDCRSSFLHDTPADITVSGGPCHAGRCQLDHPSEMAPNLRANRLGVSNGLEPLTRIGV